MCNHEWRQRFEESIIGIGAIPDGWECRVCGEYVTQDRVTPAGLGGVDTGEKVLVSPHGLRSQTSSGQPFTKQIRYPDGRLEIIP